MQSIPLFRADLTHTDAKMIRSQLLKSPFVDKNLLQSWEGSWSHLWQRPALAFADATELIAILKRLLGWESGDRIECNPLLEPAWREALAANWLSICWRDIDPCSGQIQEVQEVAAPIPSTVPFSAAKVGVRFAIHPYGLSTPAANDSTKPFWLEDISTIIRPVSGCGWGDVQVLHLSGNRMLAAGGSCLLLTQNKTLYQAARELRRYPPSGLALALGLAQLQSLDRRLERRQVLAERYQALRHQGLFHLPAKEEGGRVWEMFLVQMHSATASLALQAFLRKAEIHATSPLWFQSKEAEHLPGYVQFQERVIALPLYASLTDPEQKRIINRIHRWVERTIKHKMKIES